MNLLCMLRYSLRKSHSNKTLHAWCETQKGWKKRRTFGWLPQPSQDDKKPWLEDDSGCASGAERPPASGCIDCAGASPPPAGTGTGPPTAGAPACVSRAWQGSACCCPPLPRHASIGGRGPGLAVLMCLPGPLSLTKGRYCVMAVQTDPEDFHHGNCVIQSCQHCFSMGLKACKQTQE